LHQNETVRGPVPKVSTGIDGLDQVLLGGLPPDRLYLIEGAPGTGKTTLALQFLLEGRDKGERGLYITLSETKAELSDVAASHGWSLEGIELYELESTEARLTPEEEYTIFRPEDVELSETVQKVRQEVERLQPNRVVFDSLSEMQLLARDPLRYRRQILALKQFFAGRKCTVLLLDDMTGTSHDLQLQSIAHGVITLERLFQEYGISKRRLNVIKLRGAQFRDGYHDYDILRGGLRVFPRLVAGEHRAMHDRSRFASGISALDRLLGGGLNRGTSTLVIGPAGSGKSSIAGAFLIAAAKRGEHAASYVFEEGRDTFIDRMSTLGMDVRPHIDANLMTIQQIDPAEVTPGQFAQQLRDDVDQRGARVIVIDSLNGYLNAMPNERFLLVQMHEQLSYLAQKGVVCILIMAQHGLIGAMQNPIDVSYLADALIMLRFFEFNGRVKRAISVIKHRKAAHEDSIREFRLSAEGIYVGEPLESFRGVLTGVPEYTGGTEALLENRDGD
jgi:circadian clock protein KaiC